MALVELRNVSKIYRLGEEEIRALDDVSLDIGKGISSPLSAHQQRQVHPDAHTGVSRFRP